jgi:hypothetical protein
MALWSQLYRVNNAQSMHLHYMTVQATRSTFLGEQTFTQKSWLQMLKETLWFLKLETEEL